MSTHSKTAQGLLAAIQKAGKKGVVRSTLLAKGKTLEKQTALQELENDGSIVTKTSGAIVFLFSAGHPPLPAHEALVAMVRQTTHEKGAVLWKEADLIKALTKLKHYTTAEATAAAKALCSGAEMLEVKDGKARKYLHQAKADPKGKDYFVSESARLIYALAELDGECRQRVLGLTHAHYRDAELAKEWRNRIAKQIHPDVCGHPKAQQATDELAQMYQEMTL